MAFVVAFPVLWLSRHVTVGPASEGASIAALGFGLAAVAAAFWKTRGYVGWSGTSAERSRLYPILNLIAWGVLIGIPCVWGYLCQAGWSADHESGGGPYLVGLCFSFRCLHPDSGVSPLVPVLLLLLGWYVWSVFQTLRLRFSATGRPRLPRRLSDDGDVPLFVSDDDLEQCEIARHNCLFKNITCLLITRQVVRRLFAPRLAAKSRALHAVILDLVLAGIYVTALLRFSLFSPMHSLDHFLWRTRNNWACPFEILVGGLFFPLLAVSLAGWLRMILIWGSLRRGLLERLENMPIRRAFSRLQVMGWMTMLRYGGVEEQWRDVARSLESMRQILNQDHLRASLPRADWLRLNTANVSLLTDIKEHRKPTCEQAKGVQTEVRDYTFMKNIEIKLAAFSQELLSNILIPYWKHERSGLVESDEFLDDPYRPRQPRTRAPAPTESSRILAAEEFVAIRYISLIRAVLANLRYLMIFVSVSFVLAILAWNSYPFQPRQLVDWSFTGLLAVLGTGVILVFAQMHRNAILSRITDTKANELGWDFYLRIISFGVLPVLTWLAYQFPDIGDFVTKFVQPAVPVIK
jgi:hypothetical protein